MRTAHPIRVLVMSTFWRLTDRLKFNMYSMARSLVDTKPKRQSIIIDKREKPSAFYLDANRVADKSCSDRHENRQWIPAMAITSLESYNGRRRNFTWEDIAELPWQRTALDETCAFCGVTYSTVGFALSCFVPCAGSNAECEIDFEGCTLNHIRVVAEHAYEINSRQINGFSARRLRKCPNGIFDKNIK